MTNKPFRELCQGRHSKKVALKIIDDVLRDPSRMDELMECFFDDELRICQRAAWPVGMISEHNPHLILPYLEEMLLNLEHSKHDALIRNTFRTLQNMDVPEDIEGLAFEKAFNYLLNPQNAIAIRVFAMTVCANIAKKYPELKHELIPVIEEQIPYGSAGFVNRGHKILKALKK